MRTRPRATLGWVAALLATFAMTAPASAQVMTITGATPTTYSGPGETITFHVSLGGSNAVTNTVELTRIAYGTVGPINCVGLPLDPLASTTCSFTYVTQAGDVFGLNQSGTFRVTTLAAPRTKSIANAFRVPYVPVPPTASIVASTANVTENGAQSLSYTVTLSDPAAAPISVYFSLGGSATAGVDYAASANPLVIATGTTTGTITLDPTGDATVEADETVDVSLVAGSGYTLGAPTSASGTIVNDDVPSLSINDVSLAEGNAGTTNATFTVSLSQPAGPGGVSFDIATANGTASAGTDYAANSLTGQTIPAGSSTYSFTVPVNGDTLNEPTETFFVNVTNVTNAVVGDGQGVSTIVNDDALPGLSIGNASVIEGNAGTVSATFTVSLSAASGQNVSVNYATANGTATAGSDYVAASGTLTFSPGQTSQTLDVQVAGDTTVEPDETFSVGLSGPTNASIVTAAGTGTILNDDVVVVVNPASLPNAAIANAYSQTLTASGAAAPYTFAVTAGALPAGLNFSAGGLLSGTPTATGTFNFTVTATDANGVAGARAYSVTVSPPTITVAPTTLSNGTIAAAYSQSVTASGGVAPYSYAITAGPLPAGLTLSSAGGLSGTPTAGGSFNFTVTATDSSVSGPYSGSLAYALTIAAPSLVLVPAAGTLTASYNVAYSLNVSASGGTGPYSYSLVSGSLPVGVSFTSAGLLSGTSTVPGSYPLAIRATDSSTGSGAPYSVTNNYTLEVSAPAIVIDPAVLPGGAVGTAYNTLLSASGGVAPYSYSLLSGALPIGMTFSSAGQFSGIPRSDGNFNLTVRATDANGQTGSRVLTFSIAAPTLAITPATLPAGTTSIAYSQALATSGGIAPYSYSIVSGSLPIGMSFSSAGVISGTPTTAGSYTATIRSTDDVGYNTTVSYTIAIDAPVIVIDPATLLDGNVGTAYNAALSASGGAAPYSYSLMSGALPIGMTFNSAGQFSGIPRSAGSFSLTVRATDANGNAGTQSYTFSIAAPTLAITPATLPAGTTNIAYSQSLATSGGIAPYSYSVVSGSLPIGVSFSSVGVFSGTPTTAGSYTATLRSTDDAGYTVDASYTIAIDAPVIVIDPATLDAAVVGNAYAATLTANGGAAPYTFALETGALPSGISLGSAGGLSGTPSASGMFNFDVRATDSNGNSGTRAYALVVVPRTLVLDPTSLPAGASGTAYSQSVSASGGIAPYSYALSSGALPAGLSFANGVLSGTPTASGTFTFDITASDSGGGTPATTTRSYTLVIAAAALSLDPASLPGGIAGATYSQALTISGGIAPYTAALTGSLPAGLSFNPATHTLSGTPTQSGTFNLSVVATDSTGGTPATVTNAYVLTIAAPTLALTPGTLPDGIAGIAYNQSVSASGGIAPYSYALSSGALPAGLTFANGALSGTPTASGSFSFDITASDSTGGTPATATRSYTLVIAAATLNLDPASLPAGIADTAYNQNVSASGGIAPYGYALSSGALPAGLTFVNGALSGTPTASGSFTFDITASDSTGGTAATTTRSYTLVIAAATLSLDPASLPDATVASAYNQSVTASGGIASYSYAVTSGALPAGMTFVNGTLSGMPTASGSFTFDITASDSSGGTPATTTRSYTLVIAAAILTLAPGTLPDGIAGATYSQALTISGGIAPYTAALTGSLPAGLTFNPATHTLSGTPTQSGMFNLSVVATDSTGGTPATVTSAYVLTIAAPALTLTPGVLPAGIAGIAYSQTVSSSGGIAPYGYALSSGALPAGLTFVNGTLSGTPTASGSFSFDITASDSTGGTPATTTRSYTLVIAAATLSLDPASMPSGIAGTAYSQSVSASGGIAPYSYALTSGALPAGMTFANGALSGTPTASGSFSFDITATDSTSGTAATVTHSYTLVIAAATLSLDPASLPAGVAGTVYSQALTASGGIAPYSYALTHGVLPVGLSFANGVLSGMPTASGSFSFDITASDSTGGIAATVTHGYTLVIAAPTLTLGPGTLPDGIAGTAYNQALTASGGIAPYTYALTSGGALPAGLILSDTGVLAGTSTVAGSFTFRITASDSTDGTAATVSSNFTLVIAAPVIAITPATLPDGVRGSAYQQVFGASGGTAAYAFALSSGALPAGVTLAADGTLAGTPTADGNFSFAVTVTDALGFTATVNTIWVVAMDPPVVVDDAAAALGGAVVSIPVTANDTGTINSIAIAAAPAHGTAIVNGLEVAYTPEAGFSGADSFRYTATGPGGTSAEATVKVTVNPLPVAVSRRLAANAGVAVDVDLTEGATGGPFTAATIVSLSPASAGTASIAQVGSGDAARHVLTYTPAAVFSGLATVRFTLGNVYATSAEATLEFDVTARPDPSQDPEVRALLSAQAAATRRFATAQINNFQQRLEKLHGDGDSRFSNQVSFSADGDGDCENQVGRIPGRRCEHVARNDDVAHAAAVPAEVGNAQGATFGTWIGGVIRSGNHDGRGGNAGIDFESDGLSVGADYRLNRKFALGGGLGWGRDDSDVGEHGSRSEGKAYTAALYASFHPDDRLFVDGLMGYQGLSYDLRRYVTSNGALVQGARDGTQWFASLSAGADIRHGEHLQLTPYARLDLARATLDAYTEHGDPLYSLHYANMDVDTTTGNLGLRVDYRRELSRGLFSPQLRLEYQHDFQGNGDATMGYADQLSGPFYRTGLEAFDRNRFVIGLGAQFSTDRGLSTRIEYRGVVGDGEDSDHGFMLNIEKRY